MRNVETEQEIIRRVEQAPLHELVAVDMDDVTVQMDRLLQKDVDAASLYRRWETQQWAVSELDLEPDKRQWAQLHEGLRTGFKRTMIAFFIGEQAVTDTLSPLLYAAPSEDERIFLATQVADEARHTVFFERYFEEVLGLGGGLSSALRAIGEEVTEGYRRIFDHELVDALDLVRRRPHDERAWVEAVVTYHIVIEGYLALTGQWGLLKVLRAMGALPGFTAGFTAVARDESRHIGFGVLALRRRIEKDPEVGRIVLLKVLALLPHAVSTSTGRGRRLLVEDPNQLAPNMRLSPLVSRDFAITSLSKRLRASGLSEQAVTTVAEEMTRLYDESWAHYEEAFGTRHPVSYYRAGLVS